jgi:choline dehydrogenase
MWGDSETDIWSYRGIRPLIDEIEAVSPESATQFHGSKGMVPTKPYDEHNLSIWQRFFLHSAISSGFPRLSDLSAPFPFEGVGPYHANVRGHTRWNAAFAFLDPLRDFSNFTILPNVLVDKLEMHDDEVRGVSCVSKGNSVSLKARRYVLSAGAYGSPSVLLRSGIGPGKDLENLNIPVKLNLPGVGENLHDHPGVSIDFVPTEKAKQGLEDDFRTGRFFQSEVLLRARSSRCTDGFDLHLAPYQSQTKTGDWSFEIFAFLMTPPSSRGKLSLGGKSPLTPPRIEFRFLTDFEERDAAVLAEGVRLGLKISRAYPLSSLIRKESRPDASSRSGARLISYIRSNVSGYDHPVGTCKMGSMRDETTVVDWTGLVHNTTNLFVADGSIIRDIPRANTNLSCFLVGLRIAISILETERKVDKNLR